MHDELDVRIAFSPPGVGLRVVIHRRERKSIAGNPRLLGRSCMALTPLLGAVPDVCGEGSWFLGVVEGL